MRVKIFTILLLFVSSCVYSQKIFLGGRLGATSMFIKETGDSAISSLERKTGTNVAIFSEFCFGKFISVQTEANFTIKGYMYTKNGNILNYEFDYLDFPIIVRPKIPINDYLELYGEIGPSISIGVKGIGKKNNQYFTDLFGKEGYNNIDFGMNYGLGLNGVFDSKYKVGLGVRFFNGLSNIYPNNIYGTSAKNNGLIVAVNFAKLL